MRRYIIAFMMFVIVMCSAATASAQHLYDPENLLSETEKNIIEESCNIFFSETLNFVMYVDTSTEDAVKATDLIASQNNADLACAIFANDKKVVLKSYSDKIIINSADKIAEIAQNQNTFNACRSVIENIMRSSAGRALWNGGAFRPAVQDTAGVISDSDQARLEDKLNNIRNAKNTDVAVVILDKAPFADAQHAADYIYDYYFYGLGSNDDGILLYIALDTRDYHFTTHGKCEEMFGDKEFDELEDNVVENLSYGDYAGAVEAYADTVEGFLSRGAASVVVNKLNLALPIPFIIVVSLVCAFVITYNMQKGTTNLQNQHFAADYAIKDSLNIFNSNEWYLYSNTTKTPRDSGGSSRSGRSGGGSHRSSSGRSHGGRGGKF